jgi:hypothetical protein
MHSFVDVTAFINVFMLLSLREQIKESAGLLDVIPWYLKTVGESF